MPRPPHRSPKPASAWRQLIADWAGSGQSVAAFCAARDVSPASFYAWRQRLEAAAPPPAPAGFVPVRVVPDPIAEVVLPGGVVLRVPVSADPAAVAGLIAALRGAGC
jgi:hypothetical protein